MADCSLYHGGGGLANFVAALRFTERLLRDRLHLHAASIKPPQRLYFLGGKLAELAGFHIQRKRAIAHPSNLFYMMANFFKHSANLPVTALNQCNFVPGIVTLFEETNLCRSGTDRLKTSMLGFATDPDSVAQLFNVLVRSTATDLHQIRSRNMR